jgi:Fe-S cluster assembly protein SufD
MTDSRRHEHYFARFERFLEGRIANDPSWLRALRVEAMGAFSDLGFPSTKLEEWKYTNVGPIAALPFELADPGEAGSVTSVHVEEIAFPLFACSLFVFVNGQFQPGLSTPHSLSGDLHVESLASLRQGEPSRLEGRLAQQVDFKTNAFAALNTAFLDDGAVISIPKNEAVEQPIHLVFIATEPSGPRVSHPRLLIEAGAGSQATIVIDTVSLGGGERLTNLVTEVVTEPNAKLDLVQLQREDGGSFCITSLCARQERDSQLTCHTVTLGGALVRNDLAVTLGGEGAACKLNGLFVGTGEQTIDNHTLVDHALPHGTSRELYKGILGGRSRGVFRGRVIVRPDAQKTDATQSNPNLLLSDGAQVNTKPQLEIYADDVKCSHGSSIGQLDADTLFYLRSRGIDETAARDLLAQGFASEITSALPSEALGERVREILLERLRDASAQKEGA